MLALPLAHKVVRAPYGYTVPISTPVSVPYDFVGVHLGSWPAYRKVSGSPDSPPNFGYSWVRAQSQVFSTAAGQDSGPLIWSVLNPSSGVYAWNTTPDVDLIFNTYASLGKKMIYDLQSTPHWASSGTDTDPWGSVGGNVKPTNLSDLTAFITALLTRYKTVIRAVEVWNEPSYNGAAGGFFIGSAADMVQIASTIYSATKAVDPTITVIAPCYGLDQFLAAGGGPYVDAISVHGYGHVVSDALGTSNILSYILAQHTIAVTAGYGTLPIWETERGFSGNPTGAANAIAALGGQDAAATETKRIFLVEAALGIRACMLYSFDTGLHGDMKNNAAVQAAIQWAYSTLSGGTISSCQINSDRSVTAVINGTQITV